MEARTAGRTAPDARSRDLPTDARTLPPLADGYAATLDAGLAALGQALTGNARAAIDVHVRLLLAWNAAINLTAITDPAAIASRHVLDSLAAVSLVPHDSRLLDLGSGGGFPGLPIAAAVPSARVTLLDSVAKKTRFLQVARDAAGLEGRVAVRTARAESLAAAGPSWDVVAARAVGSLAELAELAMPILPIGGRLLAWKRGDLGQELAALERAAPALGTAGPVTHPIEGIPDLAGHVIVEIGKAQPTARGYPRDPGRRAREPW